MLKVSALGEQWNAQLLLAVHFPGNSASKQQQIALIPAARNF
jgi:hypothetical protein